MSRLRDSLVLVTGASGGLGQAIARALSAQGARLVLSGRRAEVLGALAGELRSEVVVADLSVPDDVDRLAGIACDLDVVVANAALPASGPITGFDREEIRRALAVNLEAPIALARAVLPRWTERRSGHLVFVSSLAGRVAPPASSLYSATKFGLRGFAGGLRSDLYGSGVEVSTVSPGFVRDAGMFADSGAKLPPGIGTVTPEAVGAAVVYAIESGRAEVDVAPLALRAGVFLGSMAPGLSAALTGRFGRRVASRVAAGQREKR